MYKSEFTHLHKKMNVDLMTSQPEGRESRILRQQHKTLSNKQRDKGGGR